MLRVHARNPGTIVLHPKFGGLIVGAKIDQWQFHLAKPTAFRCFKGIKHHQLTCFLFISCNMNIVGGCQHTATNTVLTSSWFQHTRSISQSPLSVINIPPNEILWDFKPHTNTLLQPLLAVCFRHILRWPTLMVYKSWLHLKPTGLHVWTWIRTMIQRTGVSRIGSVRFFWQINDTKNPRVSLVFWIMPIVSYFNGFGIWILQS